MVYCMTMVFIFLPIFFMVGMGILQSASISFLHGMYVVALAHVVMTLRGSTFHHLAIILTIIGLNTIFIKLGIKHVPFCLSS